MGIYHITWATHNSRVSERMIKYGIWPGEPVLLDSESELFITITIARIVNHKGYRVHAYNICRDHVHLIIECAEKELPGIIRLLKGKSAQRYKEYCGFTRGGNPFHLWTQKYGRENITSDEHYYNAVHYVVNNREKHGLPDNEGLRMVIRQLVAGHGSKGLQPLAL